MMKKKATAYAVLALAAVVTLGAIVAATLASPLSAATGDAAFPHVSAGTAPALPTWSGPAAAGGPAEQPSEVLVEFARGTQKAKMAATSADGDIKLKAAHPAKSSKSLPFAVYSSATLSADELAKRFRGQPGVVAVSPNITYAIDTVPNDPLFRYQWGLQNLGGASGTADADIDASEAWDVTTGSADAVVAIIDTGTALDHWELENSLWQNSGETPSDGIDNDGNGYIDDIRGIETVGDHLNLWDRNGHGTHVAGIVAAAANNANGIAGMAWQTKIMTLRALDGEGYGTEAAVVECINYAIDMKVDRGVNVVAINTSWGDESFSLVLKDAIDAAGDAGIIFCAAAGNDGTNNDANPQYPASFDCPNIISVGASDSTDVRASFSNFGAVSVDLFAPGVDILSTYPNWAQYIPSDLDPFFDDMESGTGNWVVTGASHGVTAAGRWALSTEAYMSPNHAWVDNPGTTSPTSYRNWLTTKPLDLSVLNKDGGWLGYALLMDLGGNDKLYVRAAGDGIMYQLDVKTGYYNGWAYAQIPASLMTKQFQLRFEVATDAYDPYNYVFIDDVGIRSKKSDTFVWMDGTSMAAPFVTGTVALLAAVAPSDTVATRVDHILSHVDQKPWLSGYCATGGRLNAEAAVKAAVPPPIITSLSPDHGWVTGGTSVEIAGANFLGVPATGAVSFGGIMATSYTRVSDTKITAVAPAHLPGVVNVRVTAAGGSTEDTAADDYEYVPLPVPSVTLLSPANGTTAGGTGVIITGVDLTGTTSVSFGGTAATRFTVDSDTQITAIAPARAAGTVNVVVTAPGGSSSAGGTADDFVYAAAPTTAKVEQTVTTGLTWSPSAGAWLLGSSTSYSGGSFRYINGTVASPGSVTALFKGTYLAWIAKTSPAYGLAKVTVDGVRVYTVDLYSASTLYQKKVFDTGVLPAGLHSVKIEWTGQKRTAATAANVNLDRFDLAGTMVAPPPTISGLSRDSGSTSGGTQVKITGTNFTLVSGVTFGGTPATTYTVNSSTEITARTSAHTEGTVQVQVTTLGGTTGDTAADDYSYRVVPPPAVTGLSPTSGSTTGGTAVTISGTDLSDATSVTFGDTPATRYTVNAEGTGISAVAPAHPAGVVQVKVTTIDGPSADTGADDFKYVAPPVKVQQSSTSLVYSGTWSTLSTASASGGSYKRSYTAGAYVVIPFYGTRLDWIATKGTTMGKADVSVDGVLVTDPDLPLDLYRSPAAYQQTIFSTGELEPGYHTVKIQRSTLSVAGKYINIDAVLVYGTVTAKTTVQQTDTRLDWTPSFATWATGNTSYASGSSYKYINKEGSVTIDFTGVSLDILAKKAPSYGIAKLTVDGDPEKVYLVNLYRSANAYKQTVWSSGWLAPGDHTVTIEWTGTKGTGATGTTIDLDAVLVRGVLR